VVVAACNRMVAPTAGDWVRWFNETVSGLSRSDGHLPAPDGPVVQTYDGLSLRLGRTFEKRNDYGCWAVGRRQLPPDRRWRDVCVSRVVPEQQLPPSFSLQPVPRDPKLADQYVSSEWDAGVVTIDGRRAIVERARVSGGLEGAFREHRTAILIELPGGGWAHVEGCAGEPAGLLDLLGIAGTIRATARPDGT